MRHSSCQCRVGVLRYIHVVRTLSVGRIHAESYDLCYIDTGGSLDTASIFIHGNDR